MRGGCGSPTPPISRNLHKRETQKCTNFAEGGARPCLGSHSGGRQEGEGRGGRARERWWGCLGEVNPGGNAKEAGWVGGASRAVPTPPQGPREREGQRLGAEDRIQGRCVFGFPHVLPPLSPVLEVSRLPRPPTPAPEAGAEPESALRIASTTPHPLTGADRVARRLASSLSAGRSASPEQGRAGGGDAQGTRQGGRRARWGEVPWTAPGFSGLKTWRNRVPTVPHLRPPCLGAAPTSSARAVQAASRTRAKPGSIVTAQGTECAAVRMGSNAPLLCPCHRRRRPQCPQRSGRSECSLPPPPRKLTEQERGGGLGAWRVS